MFMRMNERCQAENQLEHYEEDRMNSFYRLSLFFFIVPLVTTSYADENHEIGIAVAFTTEGSWNMAEGKVNWENCLNMDAQVPLWKGAVGEAGVLANQNTRLGKGKCWTVLDDPQSFSNIQTDEQIPLSPAVVGISQKISDHLTAFLGVRNMNVDYFTTPLTSLFINSSYGIFPTLADNCSLANYPEAALCLHLVWTPGNHLTIKNSLYNGRASHHWDEAFRFRPSKDGWADAFEVGYSATEHPGSITGEYHFGAECNSTPRTRMDENTGESYRKKCFNWSCFGLIEQPLVSGRCPLGLLLEGGYAPKRKNGTYLYMAAGLVCEHLIRQDDAMGLSFNRSLYNGCENENCMELTYSLPVIPHLTIQPDLQFFHITSHYHSVALLRARVDL